MGSQIIFAIGTLTSREFSVLTSNHLRKPWKGQLREKINHLQLNVTWTLAMILRNAKLLHLLGSISRSLVCFPYFLYCYAEVTSRVVFTFSEHQGTKPYNFKISGPFNILLQCLQKLGYKLKTQSISIGTHGRNALWTFEVDEMLQDNFTCV